MIERQTELKRRYHRKKKMAKLKAKLTTGGAVGDARTAILARIKKLSPTWTEASLAAAVPPGRARRRTPAAGPVRPARDHRPADLAGPHRHLEGPHAQ